MTLKPMIAMVIMFLLLAGGGLVTLAVQPTERELAERHAKALFFGYDGWRPAAETSAHPGAQQAEVHSQDRRLVMRMSHVVPALSHEDRMLGRERFATVRRNLSVDLVADGLQFRDLLRCAQEQADDEFACRWDEAVDDVAASRIATLISGERERVATVMKHQREAVREMAQAADRKEDEEVARRRAAIAQALGTGQPAR